MISLYFHTFNTGERAPDGVKWKLGDSDDEGLMVESIDKST